MVQTLPPVQLGQPQPGPPGPPTVVPGQNLPAASTGPQQAGGPQQAPTAPKSPEELQQRVVGWRQFLARINTDPALQDALLRFGTSLMQPVPPGQTAGGQFGAALQGGATALRKGQARERDTAAAGRAEERDVERLKLEKRRTGAVIEQGAERLGQGREQLAINMFRAITDRNRKASGGGAIGAAVQNRSDYAWALLVNDGAPGGAQKYTGTDAQKLAAAKIDAARFLKEEDLLTIAGRILAAKQQVAAFGDDEGVDIVAESIAEAKALKRGINTGGIGGDTDFIFDEEGNVVPK